MNPGNKKPPGFLHRLLRGYRYYCFPIPLLCRRFIARIANRTLVSTPVKVCVDLGAGIAPYRRLVTEKLHVQAYVPIDVAISDPAGIAASAQAIPLQNRSVDLILSFDVFQHLEDAGRSLGECARILRSGGHLLATYPFMYGECDHRDFRRWSLAGFEEDLRRNGFRVVLHQKRGGSFFALACAANWMMQHVIPGGRSSWRAEKSVLSILRTLVVMILTIPTILLEWIALFVDQIVTMDGFYMGACVLAILENEDQPAPSQPRP